MKGPKQVGGTSRENSTSTSDRLKWATRNFGGMVPRSAHLCLELGGAFPFWGEDRPHGRVGGALNIVPSIAASGFVPDARASGLDPKEQFKMSAANEPFVSAFPPPDERLLGIAESLKPKLLETRIPVSKVIVVERDESAILGWSKKRAPVDRLEELPLLSSGDQCILDVGEHVTGYLEFGLAGLPHEIEPADAPARIKLTFGEVLNDVAESFEPYKYDVPSFRTGIGASTDTFVAHSGFLSKSWLPEETVVLQKPHYKPQKMRIANRYAFRYIKIEVVATSIRFGLRFSDMIATAVSSVGHANPCPLTFESPALDLTDEQKHKLRQIDDAAMVTLRDCMQTVYEDGPRRDQRLWIGDLRLQALASYATYKDRDLVKRCLYLFAAMPFDAEGKLCACAYEEPEPHTGGNSISEWIGGERRCSPSASTPGPADSQTHPLQWTTLSSTRVPSSTTSTTRAIPRPATTSLKSLASSSTSPPAESARTLSTKSRSRKAC